MRTILCVCTGNTCRSPMAEGLLKSESLPDTVVISRGLAANGDPASKNSVAVMRELGIDIAGHISKPLTLEEAQTADLILCMSASHAQILGSAGIDQEKIKVLDIPDPFGGDIQEYRACRDAIKEKIAQLKKDGVL